MLNQLRADYFRLFHSKHYWVVGSVFVGYFILFVIMSLENIPYSTGSVLGYKDGIPLLDGFIGLKFQNPAHPLFWELVYSSTVFTGILWIIFMGFAVAYISKEYQTGTIKLAVSYGISLFKIHLSKLIVVISYSGLLYYLYNLAAFTVISAIKNYIPTFENVMSLLALVSLYYLVLTVFTLLCFVLYIVIKNASVLTTILPIYMFSTMAVVALYGNDRPFLADCYLSINPMYYLTNASRFWADSTITVNILLYAAIAIPLLLISSHFLLKKKEIK